MKTQASHKKNEKNAQFIEQSALLLQYYSIL